MLNELRRIPPGFAAFLVLGAALVTMIILAAFDSVIGGDEPAHSARASSDRQTAPLVELGKSYPDTKKPPAKKAPEAEPQQPAAEKIPLSRLVGQKLMVRMSGTSPSPGLLRRVRAGKVGGVILFPDNVGSAGQLKALCSSLQQAARAGGSAGLLIAVDQEGGPVKRLQAGPPKQSPAQIASAGAAEGEGQATGAYLANLGLNVNLAPVLDVAAPGSFIASRAFSNTPARVAELGGAFATGLQSAGVAATAKHFPGLGHATANTDNGQSTVNASKGALDADLKPFEQAIAGGVGLVMMSNATYPAYASGPAVLSRPIVQGVLRDRLRFGGVIITDDLEAGAIQAVQPASSAAVAAAGAGVDILLLARTEGSSEAAYHALVAAANAGQLDRGALEESYARITQLQQDYAH
jgi:beta-N-acetylhexosaminidase